MFASAILVEHAPVRKFAHERKYIPTSRMALKTLRHRATSTVDYNQCGNNLTIFESFFKYNYRLRRRNIRTFRSLTNNLGVT